MISKECLLGLCQGGHEKFWPVLRGYTHLEQMEKGDWGLLVNWDSPGTLRFTLQIAVKMVCACVVWQSSDSVISPSTSKEAWMSSSGHFIRLPAPPHVTGDVSVCACDATLAWFQDICNVHMVIDDLLPTSDVLCLHVHTLT